MHLHPPKTVEDSVQRKFFQFPKTLSTTTTRYSGFQQKMEG